MYSKQHWGHTSEMDYLRHRAEKLMAKTQKTSTSTAGSMQPLSRKVQREILETQRARLRRHGKTSWTRNGV